MTILTTTWVVVGVSLAFLLLGIVATIVVRIDKVPNWGKVAKVLFWIIGLVVFKVVIWGMYSSYKEDTSQKNQELIIQQRVAQELAKKKAIEIQPTERGWVYETEEPAGFDGKYDHTAENKATLIEDSDKNLIFKMYYDSLGKTESVIFFLDRKKSEGIWTKENPRMSGRWKIKSKQFQLIKDGYCITWNADRDPQTWYSAYFRQQ